MRAHTLLEPLILVAVGAGALCVGLVVDDVVVGIVAGVIGVAVGAVGVGASIGVARAIDRQAQAWSKQPAPPTEPPL